MHTPTVSYSYTIHPDILSCQERFPSLPVNLTVYTLIPSQSSPIVQFLPWSSAPSRPLSNTEASATFGFRSISSLYSGVLPSTRLTIVLRKPIPTVHSTRLLTVSEFLASPLALSAYTSSIPSLSGLPEWITNTSKSAVVIPSFVAVFIWLAIFSMLKTICCISSTALFDFSLDVDHPQRNNMLIRMSTITLAG